MLLKLGPENLAISSWTLFVPSFPEENHTAQDIIDSLVRKFLNKNYPRESVK